MNLHGRLTSIVQNVLPNGNDAADLVTAGFYAIQRFTQACDPDLVDYDEMRVVPESPATRPATSEPTSESSNPPESLSRRQREALALGPLVLLGRFADENYISSKDGVVQALLKSAALDTAENTHLNPGGEWITSRPFARGELITLLQPKAQAEYPQNAPKPRIYNGLAEPKELSRGFTDCIALPGKDSPLNILSLCEESPSQGPRSNIKSVVLCNYVLLYALRDLPEGTTLVRSLARAPLEW